MKNNLLEVQNLVKRYEKFTLGPLSFSIQSGEIVGFIGRNGAGKTTTMKSIYGLISKNEGEIKIFDEKFDENTLFNKEKIGFMLGGVDFYPNTKIKNLTKVIKRFYHTWDEKVYQKYLQEFNLDENKKINELSEGMKVKYNLALSLSHGALLFILDEPTSGLDPVSRDEVTDIFMKLTEKGDKSVLFSTHITEDLDKCADRIIYIQEGSIVADYPLLEYKNGFSLLSIGKDEFQNTLLEKAIGYRKARTSFEFLYKDIDLPCNIGTISKPDLETIMVLNERGKNNNESNL